MFDDPKPGDKWFSTTCARCGVQPTGASICSRYNSDQVCMACREDEKKLATYPACEAAELAAVKSGNYNFHYGLTAVDRAALAAMLKARVAQSHG